jgi:hypothetical protein
MGAQLYFGNKSRITIAISRIGTALGLLCTFLWSLECTALETYQGSSLLAEGEAEGCILGG